MFNLRTHAMISGGIFVLIVLMAWGGAALESSGVVRNPGQLEMPAKIVFFTLFLLFGFSMVPTIVKLFLAGQKSIGNAGMAPVKFLEEHQAAVIWFLWVALLAGLAIALPAMIRDGFLN